ncbi:MAG: GAF domain-containing protein [Pyrinomonadaceae bacterium]
MEISSDIFSTINHNDKTETYRFLSEQTALLLSDESDNQANSANLSSLIFHTLPEINWAGFYWMKQGELVLGAFQGKPACVRIALGRGVCGTAAETRQTLVIENVHEFPGHIACDSASNSEIVLPLVKNGELLGVLDIDSPILSRFDETDKQGLERVVQIFVELTDFKL